MPYNSTIPSCGKVHFVLPKDIPDNPGKDGHGTAAAFFGILPGDPDRYGIRRVNLSGIPDSDHSRNRDTA